MSAVKITLEENGSLVIPEEYRRALGLHVGDEVVYAWKIGLYAFLLLSKQLDMHRNSCANIFRKVGH